MNSQRKPQSEQHTDELKPRNEQHAVELYKLYIKRHMKEGDWMWTRFQLYLSLNIGAVALVGILLKDFLEKLPFNVPLWLWAFNCVVFIIAAYLARAWQRVCEDGARWQLIIDKRIAALEPALFQEGEGLYTVIVREGTTTLSSQRDVANISSRIARLFFILWLVSFVLSLILFVVTSVLALLQMLGVVI
jgi:hypothetical protein